MTHCSDIPGQLTHGTRCYNAHIPDWLKLSESEDASNIAINEKAHIWPYLDFLPHRSMEPFLLSLKKKTCAAPYRQSVLTFTTCESSLSIFSKEYALAALLYSRKPRSKAQARRSFAPLHTKLHQVLALLASGKDSLNILVTQNSSTEYSKELKSMRNDWSMTRKRGRLSSRLLVYRLGGRRDCMRAGKLACSMPVYLQDGSCWWNRRTRNKRLDLSNR